LGIDHIGRFAGLPRRNAGAAPREPPPGLFKRADTHTDTPPDPLRPRASRPQRKATGMANEAQNPTPAPGLSRLLWRGVFPEALGVGLTATLLVSLAVGGWLAHVTTYGERVTTGERAARVTASALASLAGRTERLAPDARDQILTAACRDESLVSARWTAGDGAVQWSWPPTTTPPTAAAAAPPGDLLVLREAVPSLSEDAGGQMEFHFSRPRAAGIAESVVLRFVLLGAASLFVFLLIYWRLRVHQRPVAAVEKSLECFASNTSEQLGALLLSSALGPTADAWNKLINEVAELRRECERAGRGSSGGTVAQRFESRALRDVLDRLPIGVVRLGRDRRISYANQSALRFLGRTAEDTVGHELEAVVNPEIAAPLIAALSRNGGSISLQRATGGGESEATLRYQLFPAAPGAPDGASVLAIEDVSHIQEAERARDNFLYHVTHELRTPLTNIHAYAETLSKPDFDDENIRRECYNVIISETRRLSLLVEDILSISQLEVGSARVELADLDIVRLLRQIAQDNLGHADEKNIEFSLRIPPKAPAVCGDKSRLAVLLNNLIGNAIKYTPDSGRVDVVMETEERSITITVADTGIGISPDDQKHVFEKFYRSQDESVQMIPGTGLGLAISREIARLHGGDITVQSQVGKGSRFVLELPTSPIGLEVGVRA